MKELIRRHAQLAYRWAAIENKPDFDRLFELCDDARWAQAELMLEAAERASS